MSTLRNIPESEAIDLIRNKVMDNGRVARVPGAYFGGGSPDDEWVTFRAAERNIRASESRLWSGDYLVVRMTCDLAPGLYQSLVYSYEVGPPSNPMDQYSSVSGWAAL